MNKEIFKLSDLVTIKSGITIRGKVIHNPDGETNVVQMRDIRRDYTGFEQVPYLVKGKQFRPASFLKPGDLLFISKGQNNYSIPYSGEFEKAVAVSFFFVLRVKEEIENKVDPFFLNWYINSDQAQKELAKGKEGTQIKNINKKTLESIAIKLPPLKEQKLIAKINQLQQKETILLQMIKEKRKQLIAQRLSDFLIL